jgi:hypothetical protein
MNRRRRAIVGFAATALFLLLAGAAGFFRVLARRPEPIPPAQYVPASWSDFRASAGHKAHVGKGNVTCRDCHGDDGGAFANPGAGICARCHAEQTAHTHVGGEHKTDCFSCHAFAPREAPTCIGCHAEKQGSHAAVTEHAKVECNECHHPHQTPSIAPKSCTSCHEERALSHAAHEGSQDCRDCHRAHEPARAAAVGCATCHERPAGPKPAGHDSCLTCHKPHDFKAEPARVCVGCHGVKPTRLADEVPAHARCTSCHAPHAPGRAALACGNCHTSTHGATDAVPVSASFEGPPPAVATLLGLEHGGKVACIGCHAPHRGDLGAKAAACTTCHGSIAQADEGAHAPTKTGCRDCHAPHASEPFERGALCAKCHGAESEKASHNRGHRDCASCHGKSAHQPAAAPACASCHGQESATAPVGHQKCASCHEPHAGERVVAAATCLGCHAKEASSLHGFIRGGCDNCHRPHGPKGVPSPPACPTCHERKTLPALHALEPHTQCSQCHTSHGPPRADRATCTATCHANRRDHQPSAQLCNGCHVFRN